MSTLRITGGYLRGRKLPLPRHEVRPTSGKARQAFFNIIGQQIQEAVFLDLFAGSGAFSLEAVSRGATKAVAVDQAREAMESLKALAREWNLPVETVTADVMTALKRLIGGTSFDVVYADPPYRYPRYQQLIEAIDHLELRPAAVVGIEHQRNDRPLKTEHLQKLVFRKTALYGNVAISIFDRQEADPLE